MSNIYINTKMLEFYFAVLKMKSKLTKVATRPNLISCNFVKARDKDIIFIFFVKEMEYLFRKKE